MAIYCGRRSDRLRAEGDHEEGRRYDFQRWRMIYDAVAQGSLGKGAGQR